MIFATLRLGKTSVVNIEKIDALTSGPQNPGFELETTCTQVPAEVKSGSFVLIWLGSDNPKGGTTSWKQGFRAIGRVESIEGDAYREPFTLAISVGYVFRESVARRDLLREAADAYYWCSEAPIIGLDDRANQTVRVIEDREYSSIKAMLYALAACESTLNKQLLDVYPELGSYMNYEPRDPRSKPAQKTGSIRESNDELPQNLIYFGAPGTGKSYQLNQDSSIFSKQGDEDQRYVARVTFHPRYSYFSFVGSYKPRTRLDTELNAGDIYYGFIPGPFTSMLIKALNNPDSRHLLILEEINRADTAGVFGDIFQLLDRAQTGSSSYSVKASDEMGDCFKQLLTDEGKGYLQEVGGLCEDEVHIVLPPNLYLWATMNSADQGVFPIDTAFKRRWEFRYVSIDEGQEKCSWNNERIALNRLLKSVAKVHEDKLIGPFFLSNSIVPRNNDGTITEEFSTAFANKVLMYLVEDAARYNIESLVKSDVIPPGAVLSDYLSAWKIHNFGIFAECSKWGKQYTPLVGSGTDGSPNIDMLNPSPEAKVDVEHASKLR